MKKMCQKFILHLAYLLGKARRSLRFNRLSLWTFLFSFVLVFSCLYIIALRGIAVRRIRSELPEIISMLNELGTDIAYDKIKFNPIFFFPLMSIENPQIYSLDENDYWKLQFNKINAYADIFGNEKLHFTFSSAGELVYNNEAHHITAGKTALNLKYTPDGFNSLNFNADELKIKSLAQIKSIGFTINPTLQNLETNKGLPSYTSILEIKDVDINGLLNYPLSSHINLITAKADLIGKISLRQGLLISLENWVESKGFIDVPQLIVQWSPLTLVGRGKISLNESLDPEISFNTSSKGMLKLLKSLQDLSWLNNSNVFVAGIILNNKAFRLDPQDKELTISTPISYSNGKISIENLVVKDFDKETQQ